MTYRQNKKWKTAWLTYIVFCFVYMLASTPIGHALSSSQTQVYFRGSGPYLVNAGDGSGACGNGSTNLVGSDNKAKVWNFLISQNFTPNQAAGIFGNLDWESGGALNPRALELPVGTLGKTGHGIVQWSWVRWRTDYGTANNSSGDPTAVSADTARQSDLTDFAPYPPITSKLDTNSLLGYAESQSENWYDLGTQLGFMMKEIQPGGNRGGVMAAIKATTTLADAATVWFNQYESPGDSTLPDRITRGQQALTQYGGGESASATSGPASDTSSSSSSCGSAFQSPDCTVATGVAKILCEAKKYDPVSYEESSRGGHLSGGAVAWHNSCPIINASCVLDCSGLVNIAVYDAFGVELNENTGGERDDIGKYWEVIPFSQIQPGDLVQPISSHVEIVDHVEGNKVYTFAAHTDHVPQPDQVGEWINSPDIDGPNSLYLHYIGPGV